ncbi:hypothetical protein AB0B85_01725 [Micromonospora sp. NPDC049044]
MRKAVLTLAALLTIGGASAAISGAAGSGVSQASSGASTGGAAQYNFGWD